MSSGSTGTEAPSRDSGGPRRAMVAMRSISKSFDGQVANRDVDFDVRAGEIHGLLGENGAGKTTLMNVLSGLLRPDSGNIEMGGAEVEFRSPRDALDRGIGMVHQHSVLVPTLTVAENVVMGQGSNWDLALKVKEMEQEVAERAEAHGIPVDPRALISSLSVDAVQRVEVLRLLYRDVTTLILDEPTATLAPPQVDQLFTELRGLREQGCGIVIVTHKLDELLALADRATVLREGSVIEVVERKEFDEAALTRALVGDALTPISKNGKRKSDPTGPAVLAAEELTVDGDRHAGAVAGVSFEVRSGEILGLAGVEGNGQMELVEALAGLRPISSGRVHIAGQSLEALTPELLDALGVAVVSGDRLRWDVFPGLSATENVLLSEIAGGRGGFTRWGFLRRGKIVGEASKRLEEFAVKPADPRRLVGTFSGGNQQRVVLARELSGQPVAVLAAYPTRGLDIAATRYVQQTLLSLRDQGAGILLVSSDLDELIELSGRVGVLFRGELNYLAAAAEGEQDSIAQAMVGLSRAENPSKEAG